MLAVLPSVWFGDSPYTTSLAVQAMVFASYGVGFNLIFGSTNQLFLCVGALAGVGGYGAAILVDQTSLPMAAGVVVGTVERGDRRRAPELDRGASLARDHLHRHRHAGLLARVREPAPRSARPHGIRDRSRRRGRAFRASPTIASAATTSSSASSSLFLIVFRALQLSHVGWAFRALRDDEVAAELAGVDVARYRIYAATIGSAMIGLTGALLAFSAGFISPATYSFDRVDVRVLVFVAFGGLGTLLGPVIGASVFAILDEQLTASFELREVLYGVFIIAIFLGFRRGVVHAVVSLARRIVPARRPQPDPQPSGE